MIFYFTGTGNSGYIANEIAKGTNDEIVSISKLIKDDEKLEFTLKDGENIGFVFPIYAWAPPKMVTDFIEKATFNNIKDNYVFSVATCGENIGNAMKIMKKSINQKDLSLNSGFSISMPNNYIIMGDVDLKEIEKEKLSRSKETVDKIIGVVNNRTSGVFEVTKGMLGSLLTAIVNPMFVKHAMNTAQFYATDECTGCGVCSKVCNTGTIKIVDQKPIWGNDCTQCLACIHTCPNKAIEYGKNTAKKGRYVNPYFKVL